MIQGLIPSPPENLDEATAENHTVGPIGQRLLLPVSSVELPGGRDERRYDDASLDALATSILRWGQIQPVVVRRIDNCYQIVCGGRRWLAVKRAGLANLWVEECTATDIEALAMRLADNLCHVGLNHAERVAALDQLSELVEETGLRATARLIGVDAGWLSRQLGVRADPVLFPALEAGCIGFGQASELRRAPADQRRQLLDRVLEAHGRVATATIRGWVAEARARSRPVVEQVPVGNSRADGRAAEFGALVEQLQTLGAPRSEAELRVLQQLATKVRHLLSMPQQNPPTPSSADPVLKVAQTEVSCLWCGELTGLRDEGGVLHVTSAFGVTKRGRQFVCGRCGGPLTGGNVRVEYRRSDGP